MTLQLPIRTLQEAATAHHTSHPHPVSPTPSNGHQVSFISWISGRGSTSCQNSSKNSSTIFCRICHEGESSGERLISPCRCSGSVGLIHRSCIEKWLSTVNHDTCELCKQKYTISRHPRPFSSWLCEPAVGDDQRNLVGDGVCFLLLTPLAGISAYLCASGAVFYFEDKQSEAIGLICLSALLVIIYVAWFLLTIRYHFQVWFKWRSVNQDIRLLDVSGIRNPGQRTRTDQREREQFTIGTTEVFEDEEIVVAREDQVATRSFRNSNVTSHQTTGHITSQLASGIDTIDHDQSGHLSMTTTSQAAAVLANTSLQMKKATHEEDNPTRSDSLPTPLPPLSPLIISHNPQKQSHSKVVQTTADSEIYSQVPAVPSPGTLVKEISSNFSGKVAPTCSNLSQYPDMAQQFLPRTVSNKSHTRTVSAPYLPALKEHFMVVRASKEPSKLAFQSRGTFSPHNRRNATFSAHTRFSSFTSNHFSSSPPKVLPSSVERYKSRPLPPIPGS